MKRIFITGNAGAGKSTLAHQVGKLLGFSVHSLDQIVWQTGWRRTPLLEKEKQIEQLIKSSNEWVIEGVSQTVLEAADTIIFLDVPRHICLWQCAKRNRYYLFQSRPELPKRCPEILIIPKLLRIIWAFPKNVRPSIIEYCKKNKEDKIVYMAKNHSDMDRVLSSIKAKKKALAKSQG